jgi:hypothetical protein
VKETNILEKAFAKVAARSPPKVKSPVSEEEREWMSSSK